MHFSDDSPQVNGPLVPVHVTVKVNHLLCLHAEHHATANRSEHQAVVENS